MTVRIHQGDALEVLRTIPAESVHCVVTSPPYFGLRDYGVPGQLGLEPSFAEYLEKLVAIFEEVRRVLRSDATAWINMGDSHNVGTKADRLPSRSSDHGYWSKKHGDIRRAVSGLKPKDLLGQPWSLAFALRDAGWYLRSEIIWHKPNPMPESVTDRPTKAHETVFLLAKSARYFYDADAVREPLRAPEANTQDDHDRAFSRRREDLPASRRAAGNKQRKIERGPGERPNDHLGTGVPWSDKDGRRNLRTVWTIATHPFPEAHFATFPPALVEPCVKAGTSEKGCCATCGAPWERVVAVAYKNPGNRSTNGPRSIARKGKESAGYKLRLEREASTTGWRPTCDHGGEPVPCVVLDPFFGAGTVGLVADRLGRHAIGIELNPEYARLAEDRVRNDCPLFAEVERG